MKAIILALLLGAHFLNAAETPSFIGAGSRASTIGKISRYSSVNKGLWSGFWRPKRETVSVKEYSWESDIKAWPNPTSGDLNIPYRGKIRIISLLGEEVFSGEIDQTINISSLQSGSYLVLTETNKSIKIIKQ